jgi:hypothetical protein
MANLNGYEGPAHVELDTEGTQWECYIFLELYPARVEAFTVAGPPSIVLYEGPVLMGEQYIYASGEAIVVNVQIESAKLKVEFEGSRSLSVGKTLPDRPSDFIPKE